MSQLEEAIKAFKEELADPHDQERQKARAQESRERILASMGQTSMRVERKEHSNVVSLRPRRWLWPLVAAFFLLGSLAAARSSLQSWFAQRNDEVKRREPMSTLTPPPANVPVVPVVPIAEVPLVTEPTSIAPAPSSDKKVPAAQGTRSPEAISEELFYQAHSLHFEVRDYARALAAWDKYLRTAPNGRLAPEARYNRAMALLHLGHRDEANAALRPFAEGTYGTYRQAEAKALLEN